MLDQRHPKKEGSVLVTQSHPVTVGKELYILIFLEKDLY